MSNGSEIKKYVIKNGPIRGHLFDAAQYALDKDVDMGVIFTCLECIDGGYGEQVKLRPTITSISHNDVFGHGTKGQSFVIKGYCTNVPFHIDGESPADAYGFEAEYSSESKTGVLIFTSEMLFNGGRIP